MVAKTNKKDSRRKLTQKGGGNTSKPGSNRRQMPLPPPPVTPSTSLPATSLTQSLFNRGYGSKLKQNPLETHTYESVNAPNGHVYETVKGEPVYETVKDALAESESTNNTMPNAYNTLSNYQWSNAYNTGQSKNNILPNNQDNNSISSICKIQDAIILGAIDYQLKLLNMEINMSKANFNQKCFNIPGKKNEPCSNEIYESLKNYESGLTEKKKLLEEMQRKLQKFTNTNTQVMNYSKNKKHLYNTVIGPNNPNNPNESNASNA
jgi:hypothetical protein